MSVILKPYSLVTWIKSGIISENIRPKYAAITNDGEPKITNIIDGNSLNRLFMIAGIYFIFEYGYFPSLYC